MREIHLEIDSFHYEYKIPAILTLPESTAQHPVVIMMHGTASDKHEVGNGYDLLAKELADHDIASVRFDFIGQGESKVEYRQYSLKTAVEDALAVQRYLKENQHMEVDSHRIGALGWSQGGTIAMLSAAQANYKSTVTWAGALHLNTMFNEEMFEIAKQQGYYTMHWDFRSPTDFGFDWFNQVMQTDVANEFSKYEHPVLAIAGSDDTVVDPKNAEIIVSVNKKPESHMHIVEGADHIFNILSDDKSKFNELIQVTTDWFRETL